MKKKEIIPAPIDNKNLMEDSFEEDIFEDFYAAPDHYRNGVRHLVGFLHLPDDGIDGYVSAKWNFGDSSITIALLAYPNQEDVNQICDVIFSFYIKVFKEMEYACNENCFDDTKFCVGFDHNGYSMKVSFWWEVK